MAEQTPSLVAESLSTCAAGQLKPLSQPCTHPASPGLLLPIHLWRAGNRQELLIHGHHTCNNSIFVLLLTNISIPRAAHLPLMLISPCYQHWNEHFEDSLLMVFPIKEDVSEVLTVNIIPDYFYVALSGSVARKAIKQDFTHNFGPGMKLMTCRKYQEFDLLLKK